MYKQLLNRDGSIIANVILRVADNACIPFDDANTDFQEYKRWLDAGGTPLPADEVTQ